MRLRIEGAMVLALAFAAGCAHGEYCIDWRSWLQSASGQSGHCWATESECSSYYLSRCMNSLYRNDCAGMCYYKAGQYPRTGAGKDKSATGTEPSAESAALQKKLDAQKQAEAAAQQQQFRKDQQGLLGGGLKGVEAAPANRIDIKLPPAGPARQQLDCAANEARSGTGEKGPDWDNPAAGCKPAAVAMPAASAPVEVQGGRVAAPDDPALREKFLAWLADQMSSARQNLSAADREVAAREQELVREEQKKSDPGKKNPAADDDALKKAREALAMAKANRERTAAELRRLEQQESEAKAGAPPAPDKEK